MIWRAHSSNGPTDLGVRMFEHPQPLKNAPHLFFFFFFGSQMVEAYSVLSPWSVWSGAWPLRRAADLHYSEPQTKIHGKPELHRDKGHRGWSVSKQNLGQLTRTTSSATCGCSGLSRPAPGEGNKASRVHSTSERLPKFSAPGASLASSWLYPVAVCSSFVHSLTLP